MLSNNPEKLSKSELSENLIEIIKTLNVKYDFVSSVLIIDSSKIEYRSLNIEAVKKLSVLTG